MSRQIASMLCLSGGFRPIMFTRGSERPDKVGNLIQNVSSQPKPGFPHLDPENKGFKLLQKMGWKENTPLGIRGRGIIEPVKTSGRVTGDVSGLGYQKYSPKEGEKKTLTVTVVSAGEKYGVGRSELGSVFIPGSSMKFIRTMGFQCYPLRDKQVELMKVYATVICRPGKHDWRLAKVDAFIQ